LVICVSVLGSEVLEDSSESVDSLIGADDRILGAAPGNIAIGLRFNARALSLILLVCFGSAAFGVEVPNKLSSSFLDSAFLNSTFLGSSFLGSSLVIDSCFLTIF